jgi:hypothetical protein
MNRTAVFPTTLAAVFLSFAALSQPPAPVAWKDNELAFKSNDPKVNVRRSEHFRILWGQGVGKDGQNVNADFDRVTEQLARGNLQMLEQIWRRYHGPESQGGMGFHIPAEPTDANLRDGNLYRTNLMMNNTGIWEGGAWGSVDERQLPLFALPPTYLAYDPPSGATPHEYGHTVQINAGGFNNTPWDGMWHEAGANWLMLQFNNSYPGPGGTGMQPYLSMPHGRNYYDAWLLFETLREDPRYGYAFINRLWTEAKGSRKEYIFDAMARLDSSGSPDARTATKDALGRMAAKNVMWDYERGPFFRMHTPRTSDPFTEVYRRAYTELIRRQGSTVWYRVPFAHAPMQGGYNVVPIALNGKKGGGYTVTVDFKPLWDPSRRSDWRATLVAVNDDGESRYSPMWNGGRNSITLSADENRLYLAVAATPDFVPFDGFSHPKPSESTLQPQAYEIAFIDTPARPYDSVPGPPTGTAGGKHPNGGGFVAGTARVDATAYVGPHALVLGNAQVLGNARVEDYAVVRDSAEVRDNAIVSGHALVKDQARVYGHGKVRDWATVGGRWQVYDNGRVLERAWLLDAGEVCDNATIKGAVADYGNAKVSGYAIKEGDCANGVPVNKQVLMCWVWGFDQKYADEQPDTGGLYANYTFDRPSPVNALDTFGLVHGYLMGRPKTVRVDDGMRGGVLRLDGNGQYVELKRDVADFRDTTYAMWVCWDGGAAGQRLLSFGDGGAKYAFLTPKDRTTGSLRFVISASGKAGEQALDAKAPLTPGRWTHVAVSFRGDTGTLYVDGRPVASRPVALDPDDVLGPNSNDGREHTWLGGSPSGGWFRGMVDDFAVWVSPRTDAEIAAAAGRFTKRNARPVAPAVTGRNPRLSAPQWLLRPTVREDGSVAMSVVKAPDDAWPEYRFRRVKGGKADSGWISANDWVDTGLAPGQAGSWTVSVRDRYGVSATGPAAGAVVPAPQAPLEAAFERTPAGVSDTAIRMTARKVAGPGLVEYRFTRDDGTTSGWRAGRTWTDTGLASGSSHQYTVQARRAGVAGPVSAPARAVARDDTPPARFSPGEWQTRPLALVDNTIRMKAMSVNGGNGCPAIEPDPVEYYFQCVEGGGPDSGWRSDPAWTSPVVPDGTYRYAFKIRDTSPRRNETPLSEPVTVVVSNLTGYHEYPIGQVLTQPEGALVTFRGTVRNVASDCYEVSGDGVSVLVTPRTRGGATDASLQGKAVSVQGCVWTIGDGKRVTWADVTPD